MRLSLGSGNGCGHDRYNFRRFSPTTNKQPIILEDARKKIGDCLGGAWDHLWDGDRQTRSERREACGLLLSALIHRLDLVTLRVGFPQADGSFVGLTDKDLARMTGLTVRRLERAMHDLAAMKIVKVHRSCERQADGSYKGRPSIRAIATRFFELIGLGEKLKKQRLKATRRREDRFLAKASQKTFEAMAKAMEKAGKPLRGDVNSTPKTGAEALQELRERLRRSTA